MYKNMKIFILGMGKSGEAAARTLCKDNEVLLTDIKFKDNKKIEELKKLGVNVIITENQEELLDNSFDLVVKNPGVKPDNCVVLKAKRLGLPIVNEMEIAYNLLPKNVKIVGITGSNGKTTTTSITYEILKTANLKVHLGGNIGIPLCSILENIKEGDILVLEISSHQLVNLDKFKTNISAITNFSEVHLDMFGTYDNYKKNKLNIFNHHTKEDIAIINGRDKDLVSYTKEIPSTKLYFNSIEESDCYIKEDKIYYKGEFVCELDDIRLKGMHNYENVMCAIMIAKEFNVSNRTIIETLNNFGGVEHRMEFVSRINGREFYNDSKATNNKSTIVALSSFKSPVILLLGGLDRGQSFDELDGHMEYVKEVICYGQTKNKIEDYCKSRGINVTVTSNLKEATKCAYNLSEEHDTILLSPACASWDQYDSFEKRGEEFKEIIGELE